MRADQKECESDYEAERGEDCKLARIAWCTQEQSSKGKAANHDKNPCDDE